MNAHCIDQPAVYLRGEPKVVKNLPGGKETYVDRHEEAESLAFVMTGVMGAMAPVGFSFSGG